MSRSILIVVILFCLGCSKEVEPRETILFEQLEGIWRNSDDWTYEFRSPSSLIVTNTDYTQVYPNVITRFDEFWACGSRKHEYHKVYSISESKIVTDRGDYIKIH